MTAASAVARPRAPGPSASVTMALSFGLTRAIAARCASSTSTGLIPRATRISDASSTARDFSRQRSLPMLLIYLPDQWTKLRSISRNSRLSP